VRSISPIAPLNTFFTSQDVQVASNGFGPRTVIAGVPAGVADIGVFTGVSGNNVVALPRTFTSVGGDSQLLGNFEYRIPIIGNTVGIAAFADVGSSFNVRSKDDQFFSSNFLDDDPFLQTVGFIPCTRLPSGFAQVTLSTLAACNSNTQLALTGNLGLVMRDRRLVTTAELDAAQNLGSFDPSTGLPFGFQQVFLRGQVQTNTAVRLSQSLFDKLGDVRTSLGMEVRVQVPVLNVPFRLIFAYNPNARANQVIDGFPFFFNEKKRVIRFSVGRTF
jgi:outer membrane protein insertion porin family